MQRPLRLGVSKLDIENHTPHLRTKYVFVDTQALRRARFDWKGRTLSKLVEFAKNGDLRLLVTDITTGEVKSQLKELLAEAGSSLLKHSGIIEQIGGSEALCCLKNQAAALSRLEACFDEFLKDARALNVPLITDIKSVLDDYFNRRPPFSAKKKAEFPDAMSVASIRQWCQQKSSTAYIISDDPDLKGCCSEAGPLFHVETISEIISRATVSRELHDALEKALSSSDYLSDELAGQIKNSEVEFRRYSHGRIRINAAKVANVHSISIVSLNVLDQQGSTFTCEPEIEAEVELNIDVEIEDYSDGPDDYYHHQQSLTHTQFEYLYPEVIVRFDPKTGELEFESIYLSGTVRINDFDFDRRWHR
ncbi:hypothetical protein ABIF50_005745 [Bradyrhizobium diazoefficiens]|uniref:DUF4935 domain-containing protein n=1 Tax=Bradyrhizobium diazoefficiens TaxID=1355477 RepID=A0A0E4FYH6_9BRAD|nr:hypothetical protein NK6_8890 [Bradyrhizobium diazoefficiens]